MQLEIEGFSQEHAVRLDLTCEDLAFLRWWLRYAATGKMDSFREDNYLFFFVAHWKVAQELPILVQGINGNENADDPVRAQKEAQARKVGKFLKKMVDKGLFEKRVHTLTTIELDKPTCKTKRVYYAATEKLIPLLTDSRHTSRKVKKAK